MKKILNINVLKIIAVISMILDHIGLYLLDDCLWLRAIGRLAFPIFAFCIAEGLHHTRNVKAYILKLLICAIVSQIPTIFLLGVENFYKLNILFTFLVSIFEIYLLKNYMKKDKGIREFASLSLFIIVLISLCITNFFQVFDYGVFGVLITILFYFFRDNKVSKYIIYSILIVLMSLFNILVIGLVPFIWIQFISIIDIVLFELYNGQKGKLNLKYFFYFFYPIHLILLLIIKLL